MTNPHTIGKYEIIKELGRGGFGVVYQARNTRLGRLVALKLLHTHLNLDPAFASRFEREARAITALDHPSIVRIYDIEEINGQLAIVMAYLPGQTLRELIQVKDKFALEQAVPILSQVADALDYVHAQGLIHRDVKPGNIIITEGKEGQRAILFDLGLSKTLADHSTLTTTGTLLGSPEYMAPEQADPNRTGEVGPAADRYALGIIAYEMLTGRVPFPGNTPSTLYAHEHKAPPPPRQLQPELPEAVEVTLLKMLAKAPTERYETATAFVIALEQSLQLVQREVQLKPLYEQLQAAYRRQDWSELLVTGSKIEAIKIDYRDVPALMAEARRQLRPRAGRNIDTVGNDAVPLTPVRKNQTRPQAGKAVNIPAWLWKVGSIALLLACLGGLGLYSLSNWLDGDPTSTLTTPISSTAALTNLLQETPTLPVEEAPTLGNTPIPPTPTVTSIPTLTLALGATRTREADGMMVVYVPAGTFPMGSDDNDPEAHDNEKPQHQVTLDAFWIDQTEVTNAQYEHCVTAGDCAASGYASDPDFNRADYPVVGVSWQSAVGYCAWVGGRLPTEAEWKYAARGPEGSIYPWGDTFDGSKLNSDSTDGYAQTAPVGKFPEGASWVGALDMAGNVWEWAQSEYRDYPYRPDDGRENLDSINIRVLRGGSWYFDVYYARATSRFGGTPDARTGNGGVRCVSAAAPE
jgi:formylglycine-generating enzyme required for sulfatase activity